LFLNSLPSGSFFNVLSFGSSFNYLYPKSLSYSKENLVKTLNAVSSFKGDMGGTNLYRPLSNLLASAKTVQNLPRNVFVLTDGEIEDRNETCDLIGKHSHETRVHTFGFGSGVD